MLLHADWTVLEICYTTRTSVSSIGNFCICINKSRMKRLTAFILVSLLKHDTLQVKKGIYLFVLIMHPS